jgi:hypothetical protein
MAAAAVNRTAAVNNFVRVNKILIAFPFQGYCPATGAIDFAGALGFELS